MTLSTLTALSPLDGRYGQKLTDLQPIFSEYGLIKYRTIVEVRWLQTLCAAKDIPQAKKLSKSANAVLESLVAHFSEDDARAVKALEKTTNHDVKAVEYFLRDTCQQHDELKPLIAFIHFGCTSEDINNLSYALMLKEGITAFSTLAQQLIDNLHTLAQDNADLSMLSRTHGQPASPTTLGKELANVVYRLKAQLESLQAVKILGKCNGAVGNFNAHAVTHPSANWRNITKTFVESLGLQHHPMTTQIEPHDYVAEIMQAIARFNTVLIDFNRDVWGYISLGYFQQKTVANEVGSSTMPHKVNPIDFENGEGNLGLANALANHLAMKLPISRWQRDLTDSTVMRNVGTVFGYSCLAFHSTLKGISKLIPNEKRITQDLEQHWEVLAEAIQMVMRAEGITDAYEQLKAFTRGKEIDANLIRQFMADIDISDEARERLRALTPQTYIGYAIDLTIQP